MKRLSYLVSIGGLALVLTACSSAPSVPTASSEVSAERTTTAANPSGQLQRLDTKETERDLMDALSESDAVVDCGSAEFIEVPAGGTFECAMRSSTTSGTMVVTVGQNGVTSWELHESK
ncbi:MAG: hypothetical protein LLG14_25765 [Nocardiaceae bacterium]|nr:hypothetical protein [Nocardiaceae bacterium]